MPDIERYNPVSTPSGYGTADDGVETLDIVEYTQRFFSTSIPQLSDFQMRKALAVLTHDRFGVSCWLCKGANALYRCSYLICEQHLFMAYQNFANCSTEDSGIR